MRNIIFTFSFIVITGLGLFAQTNFAELDRVNYQYYLAKDYKNLKRTAQKLLEQGNDYYYLRMRLGILAYENHRYGFASKNFIRAKEQNPFDTIINEYIYYSYLFAGRATDAKYFLRSLSSDKKNNHLTHLSPVEDPELSINYSFNGYDVKKYLTNSLNFEAIENLSVFNIGLDFNFSQRSRSLLQYTNTRKLATFYSPSNTDGQYGTYNQNQLYFRYKNLFTIGWEISGYSHWVFFSPEVNTTVNGRRNSSFSLISESLFGLSLSHNGWYLRGGFGLIYSNFAKSKQISTEGYLTFLPFSNLNFYSTLSGFYQVDENWGSTYQSNFDVGFKVFKYLWFESGVMVGNSFLYSRNQGVMLNNSFIIPAKSFYGTLIIPTRKFSIKINANYSEINNYSWDFVNYIKTAKVVLNSFGINTTLTIKFQ
ncbi:MAG: hypothetical protein AB1777_09385 [Bacteroidota bacterium]